MKYFISTLFVISLLAGHLLGQCSDAGICTIGTEHSTNGHNISLGYSYSKSGTVDALTFHAVQIEASFQLWEETRIMVMFPGLTIKGILGTASGIGDLTLIVNQTLWSMEAGLLNGQLGGKFATGVINSSSLPQAYQPGLGTNDLLLGISYETDPFLFALGYQFSRGRSDNTVTRLRRGDDAFGRIAYKMNFIEYPLKLELLMIKRLHQSSILDLSTPGGTGFNNLVGSDQLQTNLVATSSIPLGEEYSVTGMVAIPLLKRSVNIDGLTRGLTISLSIQYSLN